MPKPIIALAVTLATVSVVAGPLPFYRESGGHVVGEAELFSARHSNPGETAWVIKPLENSGTSEADGGPIVSNYRFRGYVQTLPDNAGAGGGGPLDYPEILYRILFTTTGEYRLFVRWDGNNTNDNTRGKSDSLFADIVELKDGSGGSIADWYEMTQSVNGNFASPAWDGGGGKEQNTAKASDTKMVWTIPSAGFYTLRFTQREDGAAVDSWILLRTSFPTDTTYLNQLPSSQFIPEPSSMALFGATVLAMLKARRRRRR